MNSMRSDATRPRLIRAKWWGSWLALKSEGPATPSCMRVQASQCGTPTSKSSRSRNSSLLSGKTCSRLSTSRSCLRRRGLLTNSSNKWKGIRTDFRDWTKASRNRTISSSRVRKSGGGCKKHSPLRSRPVCRQWLAETSSLTVCLA